ncbi:MAG: zinc dependent phospholipase C family protein [Clostridia bacterium]|nr:zinc dependent phospholipase C family protein [Clostridia bacterium]
MPDYFAHRAFAENVYIQLSDDVKNAIASGNRYLLGAQGCDIYFFYRLTWGKRNIGCMMHETDARELFTKLAKGDVSYLLGFATHYALDSFFHPSVYGYAGTNHKKHVAIESDMGSFISKTYGKDKVIFSKKENTAEAEKLYESILPVIPKATKRRIRRTLGFFYLYTRNLYRKRTFRYKCDFDFTSLESLLSLATDFTVNLVTALAHGDLDKADFSRKFLEGKPAE